MGWGARDADLLFLSASSAPRRCPSPVPLRNTQYACLSSGRPARTLAGLGLTATDLAVAEIVGGILEHQQPFVVGVGERVVGVATRTEGEDALDERQRPRAGLVVVPAQARQI